MAKQTKINENFSLSYNSRDDQTSETVMDLTMNFENPKDDSVIIHRLNTWLQAIGRKDIVVSPTPFELGK